MKKTLTVACLLLCAVLLAACGTAGASESAVPGQQSGGEAETVQTPGQTVWQAQFVPLESDSIRAKLQSGAAVGENLYYISSGVVSDETPEGVTPEWPEQYWVYGPVIVKTSPAGGLQPLPYTPERPDSQPGTNSGLLFEQLYAEADGSLWVLENRYRIREEDGTSMEEKSLIHLREDGSVITSLPTQALAAFAAEAGESEGSYSFSVPGIASDRNGNLCVAVDEWFAGSGGYVQNNRICILDEESGSVRNAITPDGEIISLVRLGDGRIAVVSYRGATPVIALVDAEKGILTEIATADDFVSDVAGGPDDTLYYSAGDSFYCLHVDTAETEKLFDWSACDVAHTDGDSVCVLNDRLIAVVSSRERDDGVQSELILLSPVDAAEAPERKTLRMAVMNLYPFTSEMVSRFNRSQSEYRIEVTDYSQYNDYSTGNPEDWNAGLTRLQTELIAGNVPDLIDMSLLPVSRLGEKGLLEDLLPYIDSDPELSRDQLNMHVLETFEENGKLYQTVSYYYVLTTLGLSSAVGGQPGWTMEDFSAAMQRLQAENPNSTVFDVYTTRDDALTFLLYLQLEDYVDWSTGACSFDSEPFKQLLTFVRSFPTAYDWTGDTTQMELDSDMRLLSGQQLMKQCNLTRFEDVQVHTAGLGGAPCTFVGYPTAYGSGSMFAQVGNAFAISSSCAEKDAAWEFVRLFFLPVYQEQLSGSVFPTNLSVYEEMKQDAQNTSYRRNPDGSYALDADGNRIEADRGSVDAAGMKVRLRAATPEEIDLVEKITASTTHVLSNDESLKEILVSGAAPYFADQRSVEDTVRQIQSRASIYVNEQR